MAEERTSLTPAPAPLGRVAGTARWLIITKHRVRASLGDWRWWLRLGGATVQGYAVLLPLIKLGWDALFTAAGGIFVGQMVKRWRETAPVDMKLVHTNYFDRKARMHHLIRQVLERAIMTPPEKERFQEEALELIAMYVRAHRHDRRDPTIFANLLMLDGDDVVVVARDRPHRRPNARYPKEQMLATRAIEECMPLVSGNIQRDYPAMGKDRGYRSVLVIPVRLGHEVVGAVSVDSTQAYQFDSEANDLVPALLPYIALLAWTLPSAKKAFTLAVGAA